MKWPPFSSVVEAGQDANGRTLQVRGVPAWAGYLSITRTEIEIRVFATKRRFLWSDMASVAWWPPRREKITKAEWIALPLIALLGGAGPFDFQPAILLVAPRGGPWDDPGPNNPHSVWLTFVTEADHSAEIEDFIRDTAQAVGVSFQRRRAPS